MIKIKDGKHIIMTDNVYEIDSVMPGQLQQKLKVIMYIYQISMNYDYIFMYNR